MTNNELIKELVIYDGWVVTTSYSRRGYVLRNGNEIIKGTYLLAKQNETDNPILIPYITDMNILHRIAVKVWDSFKCMPDDVPNFHDLRSNIYVAMFTSPNEQGEHLQLAEALVNAIRYISANKAG